MLNLNDLSGTDILIIEQNDWVNFLFKKINENGEIMLIMLRKSCILLPNANETNLSLALNRIDIVVENIGRKINLNSEDVIVLVNKITFLSGNVVIDTTVHEKVYLYGENADFKGKMNIQIVKKIEGLKKKYKPFYLPIMIAESSIVGVRKDPTFIEEILNNETLVADEREQLEKFGLLPRFTLLKPEEEKISGPVLYKF